ncbi:MAG TPA: hypothetical protein IAC86_07320 [Candidatus Cryptobacteroides excrementigallinarum]|nr:hypothetical protein [Candidatus Cryptobacteroides excrementigallinarum]
MGSKLNVREPSSETRTGTMAAVCWEAILPPSQSNVKLSSACFAPDPPPTGFVRDYADGVLRAADALEI